MMIFEFEEAPVRNAKMKVVGVGGAGGNAVNRMIDEELEGVEFISMNTDAQALKSARAQVTHADREEAHPGPRRRRTPGDRPSGDRTRARRRSGALSTGADLVFVTAGMGGGTGTGAAPSSPRSHGRWAP